MPGGLLDIFDGDYYLNLNGMSKHLGSNKEYNENNPGLGLTIDNDGKFITAGGYKNSFGEPSYYLGGGVKKRLGGKDFYIEPGVLAGLISGYEDTLTPMIMPMLGVGGRNNGLNLMLAPKTDKNPTTIMMNYSVPIK